MRSIGTTNHTLHITTRYVIRQWGIGGSKQWQEILKTPKYFEILKKRCSIYYVKNNRHISVCFNSKKERVRSAYDYLSKIRRQDKRLQKILSKSN